jgi:hypothetical protein
MRLKEDGNLDLDWRERRRRDPRSPLTEEDLKDMREELISVLMRGKQLTREKATEIIEAVF